MTVQSFGIFGVIMDKTGIGVIGCGNISPAYLRVLKGQQGVEVAGLADIVPAKAQARAAEFGLRAMSVDELLADPSIKIVLNLTIPKAHASVAMSALQAGKSVYNEKPLAIAREDAKAMLKLARGKRLRVGGAPDTFMGGGIQTCRRLIDEGAIGTPVAAVAFMLCPGHENWHPDPEFYYKVGGGPMFDMGPYYLTALVTLLGSVRRVTGSARATFPTRTITSQPRSGTVIDVEVPTHVAGVMDFAAGAVGTIITSFDVSGHTMPNIQVYGSEGSLQAPDPNCFGGTVRIIRRGQEEWTDVPLDGAYTENSRGIGVADMASAIRARRKARASGELCYHVLDLMHAFHDASAKGKHVNVKSKCDRPAAMPANLNLGEID